MRTVSSKPLTPRMEFGLAVSRALLRNQFIFRFLGVSLLVYFVLGIVVYMIAFGLFYGFVKLATALEPAYRLFVRFIKIDGMPARFVKPTGGQAIYVWASLIFPAFFVFIGVRALLIIGFTSQNTLWILNRAISIILSR